MSSMHANTRGVGLIANKSPTHNLNGGDGMTASPSTTILDTLKKKMNQLKEELETSKDELERSRANFEEEKRRRECVRTPDLSESLFELLWGNF